MSTRRVEESRGCGPRVGAGGEAPQQTGPQGHRGHTERCRGVRGRGRGSPHGGRTRRNCPARGTPLRTQGPRRPQGGGSRNNTQMSQLAKPVTLQSPVRARGRGRVRCRQAGGCGGAGCRPHPRTPAADGRGQAGRPRCREGARQLPKVSPLARAKAKDRGTVGWRGAAPGPQDPVPPPRTSRPWTCAPRRCR